MANGGKGESTPLSEFISELEHFLDATEEEIVQLKNKITEAKKLLCLLSELDFVNEAKEAYKPEDIQEENHLEVNDIDTSLEEDIDRILKVAEKVRSRAKTDENIKSALRHSVQIVEKIPKKAGQSLTTSSAKKYEVGQRSIPSTAATGRGKSSISSLKTTYRQDFHMNRGQACTSSREIEKKPNNHMEEKTSISCERNLKPVKLLRPEVKNKNVTDKRKALPIQRFRNKSTGVESSSAETFSVSKFLEEMNSRKPSLLEAILKKAEIPKYRELLEGIKCYHRFQRKTGGEFNEGNKHKQKFLEKCTALDETSGDNKSELESILRKLLPFSGWAFGIESCSDINLLKEIMQKEKENLEKIISTYQGEKVDPDCMFLSGSSYAFNPREYGIWNPSAILPIFKGLEGLYYLQYENLKEQVSLQKDLHELQEYQLQIKLFQHISCIISHYFIHPENLGNEDLEMVLKNEDCVRLLLKSLAAIADFSGQLKMPIVAFIENSTIL